MYHMIVKRRLTSVFERLGKGDYEYALSDVGTTIDHHFSGDHCLGGTRTSAEAMRRWFERLFRLFPNLGSIYIQLQHPVVPGIPPLLLSGLIALLLLTGKTT